MFKIESYVTPLILSYVDKYIKNIKPEDSQVSLWGGDAVFHNLDLRLDVLEAELHSPFTFSSGHIHELRIHVPWTKLASESIVITINTIECTLKLKSYEDRQSEKSSQSQKTRSKRQEVAASPPSYMQSLMSKIVNNISIVCNNMILKYLEEDIVLSLNARSVIFTSVDSKWETAFTELTAPELMLRKLITVSDLTICLDQCNAQGKIPIYQEPLLYRCSLSVRMCSTYPNSKGTAHASKVYLDFLFPKLDFSLSDQQIPMFIRLCNLALALYGGDFKNRPEEGLPREESMDGDRPETEVADASNVDDNDDNNQQSWAGWAWGFVPAILPVYWEEENAESLDIPSERERVVRFAVFIERVNWTFKWAEVVRGDGQSRLRFQPFLTARMQGCFLEVLLAGVEWVDVQGGISHLTLEPAQSCLCGVSEEVTLYFLQGCERSAFLNRSLYDPDADENLTQQSRPNPTCHWEHHIQSVTEATLLERTPALAFDYVYLLELPQENGSEYLSQLGSELEYSNLAEKALFRLAVGPSQLKISYGLVHRLSALLHAVEQYNYPDYVSVPHHLMHKAMNNANHVEQLVAVTMAGSLPIRSYQAAVLRPLVFISLSPPHPTFDLQRLVERRIIRSKESPSSTSILSSVAAPVWKMTFTCADFQLTRPMYPDRITLALQSLASPPAALAQHAHSHFQLKLHEASMELVTEDRHVHLLAPCNAISISIQSLLLPDRWKTYPNHLLARATLESERMELQASRPQLDYALAMWKALIDNTVAPSNRLSAEAMNTVLQPSLLLQLDRVVLDYAQTTTSTCVAFCVSALTASVWRQSTPHSVQSNNRVLLGKGPNFVQLLLQIPRSAFKTTEVLPHGSSSDVPIFSLQMASFEAVLDADLLNWLNYLSASVELLTDLGNAATALPENTSNAITDSNRTELNSRYSTHRSNQSNFAHDSGLSSSLDGQTWRASSSLLLSSPAVKSSKENPISSTLSMDWMTCRQLLQRCVLRVTIQSSNMTIPCGAQTDCNLHLQLQLPAVEISCPNTSSAARLTLAELILNRFDGPPSTFPWTVSLQNFSVGTVNESFGSFKSILEPISLKCTIALNPCAVQGPKPMSIDLAIHIDMNAVLVALNQQQLHLLWSKANHLVEWFLVGSESAVSSSSTNAHGEMNELDLDFGIWLQWAMPRFEMSLETSNARTLLDMEDVTTSVDFQRNQFAKIKSRLTAVAIKLFTRPEVTADWITEPITNGIILSCTDDITRDLQLDRRPSKVLEAAMTPVESTLCQITTNAANSPLHSEAGSEQQPPQVGASSSMPGGVVTLTWTRALRNSVHQKWQGDRRQSSQQEEIAKDSSGIKSDESTSTAQQQQQRNSERYLNEIDLTIESIDLIVTEILLDHVSQLASCLSLPQSCSIQTVDQQSLLPASSATLPLAFFGSKGLRIFLVDADHRFILFSLDGAELSPRVLNPIDRRSNSALCIRPQLFDEAERCGLLYIPGVDVEDRQYQLDLTGFSISSGCWKEVANASWIARTLNPASNLHTMAENPALEWNARGDEQSSSHLQMMGRVGLTPVLTRCSIRFIYAPPIVSLEQQCIVIGEAIELSTFSLSELHLLIDVSRLSYYERWINTLQSTSFKLSNSSSSTNDATHSSPAITAHPSHMFVTCNRVSAIIYHAGQSGVEECPYLPYCSFSLLQPHVLVKSGTAGDQVLEVSTYDVRLQLPCWADGLPVCSSSLPDENLYPISLVETRPGPTCPKGNGVPSSFVTLQQRNDRQLTVQFGRPFKLNLNRENVNNLQFIARQWTAMQGPPPQQQGSVVGSDDAQVVEPFFSYDLLHLTTSQMVLEIPLLSSALVTCGINDLELDLQLKDAEMEAWAVLNAISVKAEVEGATSLQLCDPLNLEFHVRLSSPFSSTPSSVQAFCRADNLRLHVGPRQIILVQSFLQWVQESFRKIGDYSSINTLEDTAAEGPTVASDEQHYQDDLRTGAFNFQVRDSSKEIEGKEEEERPRPYQVVFNVHPASMSWAYPTPRALSRVDVYPIPLIKADSCDGLDNPSAFDIEDQVECTLQYWDCCTEQFRILRRFHLSETRFTRVPLPDLIHLSQEAGRGGGGDAGNNDDGVKADVEVVLENQIVFSDLWRIVMNFTENSLPENRPKKIIAAPPSLVACTRVDSYSNSKMVPKIQIGLAFNQASLSLHCQQLSPHSTSSSHANKTDDGFTFDCSIPADFPFATLTLCQTSLNFRCCAPNHLSFDLSTQVQATLVNFKYLVDESVLEPTGLDIKGLLIGDKSVTALVTSQQRALDLNLSQFSIHSLTACLSSWTTLLLSPVKEMTENVLYTHYLIKNDTAEPIRIGQHGTSESILLPVRSCHQYAWKVMDTQKSRPNQLHACMEGGRWRWCQPCTIDNVAVSSTAVTESKPRLPLIWTVRSLNSLQKEVVIRGQVQVANLLAHALDVKLIPSSNPSTEKAGLILAEVRAQVAASSLAPSFVFPLVHLQGIKVRLPGNKLWSGLVPLGSPDSSSKTRNVLLVRVAQKDKEESLNLWCHLWMEVVDQHTSRLLVLFSPLYVVRSFLPQPLQLHLRTPGLNLSQLSEIAGRGRESILDCPGTVDHGHQLSFKLSASLPESTPAVPLSWTMASQYTCGTSGQQVSSVPFIDDLLDQLFHKQSRIKDEPVWPFTPEESDFDFLESPQVSQPKTDVRVIFGSLNPHCHSLLVQLKPWALLVNRCGIDLQLKQSGDEDPTSCWLLPNRSVIAPPPLNDKTFHIGVMGQRMDSTAFFSPPLLLQDQDHYRFMSYHRPRLEGTVPLEGTCLIRIAIDEHQALCYLTLSSKMHDGIRILQLQPTFRIRNDTDCSMLQSGCFAGSKDAQYTVSNISWKQSHLPAANSQTSATALLFWQCADTNVGVDLNSHLFLAFRLCSTWSSPIQLFHPHPTAGNSLNPLRHSLGIPLSGECCCSTTGNRTLQAVTVAALSPANCPIVVNCLEQNGLVYLSVAYDPSPLWVLVNRSESTLAFAQASDSEPGQMEVDCDQFRSNYGVVKPGCAAFYTPPWSRQRYPEVSPPTNLPRLILAIITQQQPDQDFSPCAETLLNWSHPVHPSHPYDQFLSLSPTIDVIIRIVRTAQPNQTAIYIEPVSAVEISAKDIRGRIESPLLSSPTATKIAMNKPSTSPIRRERINKNKRASSSSSSLVQSSSLSLSSQHICGKLHHCALVDLEELDSNNGKDLVSYNLALYWPEVSFCFRDDTKKERREVARITIDHLLVEYLSRERRKQDVILRCGHLQVDNQLYWGQSGESSSAAQQSQQANGFDFPVVLLAQSSPTWLAGSRAPSKETNQLIKQLDFIRQNALVVLNLGLAASVFRPLTFDINLQPVFLFVEDHFIFALLEYLNSFIISTATMPIVPPNSDGIRSSSEMVGFPVSEALATLSTLVNLERITVGAISLDLSLRSSVKLYIALDHSPLRLDCFDRVSVLTTPYRLGQTLAMHYVSSALFKAGWVVGSLELLGSPTALARTVTLGLKDFVRLPFQGMMRGPRGLVAGIVHGSASLVSHVTAGTVTSVTQLASSVARNVDRLSFDSDFQLRSEEGRRKRPQGLAQGIGWGLSALGLSLLGALGGLAHHPLQSIMDEGTISPRSLAVGFTKGIVGVVAKPISGAADLVAQTGQGLLSATQWSEPFHARQPQCELVQQLESSGLAKILWKLSDETPPLNVSSHQSASKASRICCCLEAMRARVNDALPIRDQLAPVMLLVTTHNFCVLGGEDGDLQVVLDLNEVDCWSHPTDPTLILVRPTPLNTTYNTPALIDRRPEDEFNPHYDYQRVAEYVRQTAPLFMPESTAATVADGSNMGSTTAAQFHCPSIATMEFFLNPSTKDFFIQCFHVAKQQRKGLGFSLV